MKISTNLNSLLFKRKKPNRILDSLSISPLLPKKATYPAKLLVKQNSYDKLKFTTN